MIDEAALARSVREAFPLTVELCVSSEPAAPDRLSAGEAAALAGMTAPSRRESWLKGRAALQRLLAKLGEEGDTSAIRFPHPRLSLSHSAGWAVAAGTREPAALGMGVDLELRDPPKPATARKFLSVAERDWVEGMDEALRGPAMLRLWTLKEAAYKADPGNAGASLTEYSVPPPVPPRGTLRRGAAGPGLFRYASFDLAGGWLTLAVLTAVDR